MRNAWIATLALLAGCQSSGSSTSSWHWPWQKAKPETARGAGRNDADPVYGGDQIFTPTGAPVAKADGAPRDRDPLREPPPAVPAAASSKKPLLGIPQAASRDRGW